MTTIKLGKVSIDALDLGSRGNAVLGIRDSGKTYTATLMAERLFEAGIPFTAFDPIGVWRFLRVPGEGRGYPVVVAGGTDGDLALTPKSAPAIVEAAMQNGVSLVIDLFSMDLSKADWRRIVRDSVRLMLHRNQAHGLRHVFIEEAAEFAPQRVIDGEVYAEIEKLARMGGNSRLGYTLINQRAEEVNKAVLELCDNLFLHRQKGRNSLTALSKWLDIGNVKDSKAIVETLSTLPTGECWAWLQGTGEPIRFHVPTKNSLHPDRRVMRGDASVKRKGAVDVQAFVESMRTTLVTVEKEAKDNDPKALRAEIARLKSENRELINSPKPDTVDPKAIEEAERRGYAAGWNALLDKIGPLVSRVFERALCAETAVIDTRQASDALAEFITGQAREAPKATASLMKLVVEARPEIRRPTVDKTSPAASGDGGLTGPQRKVADALNFWRSIGHDQPRREQVAAVAGYSPSSGGFNNLLGSMRTAGWIDYPVPGVIMLTADVGAALSPDEARNKMLSVLSNPQRKIIDAIDPAEPAISRDRLGELTDYSPTSGGFNNLIGSLCTLGILHKPRPGEVALSDWAAELLG